MRLQLDSGSDFSWVFSTAMNQSDRDQFSDQRLLYNPRNSSTSQKVDGTEFAMYADGSNVDCDLYQETVSIGGLSWEGQLIGAARKVSEKFGRNPVTNGILGLSPRPHDWRDAFRLPHKTFLETLLTHLDSSVWTMDLPHWRPEERAFLNFGFIDTEAFIGKIKYTSANGDDGTYDFNVTGLAIGGRPTSSAPDTTTSSNSSYIDVFPAFVDSGLSAMELPEHIIRKFYSMSTVQNSGPKTIHVDDGSFLAAIRVSLGLVSGSEASVGNEEPMEWRRKRSPYGSPFPVGT